MSSSSSSSSSSPVSRTNIRLLNLDIITIRGASAVQTALQSGDLARLTQVHPTLDTLPWLFRLFFPLSRLYSRAHGWFLPFHPTTSPSYPQRAALLADKFTPGLADISAPVQRAADLLERLSNRDANVTDEDLSETFIDALFARFTPDAVGSLPDNVLCAAGRQVVNIGDTLNPSKGLPAKPAVRTVYAHAEKCLREIGVLPDLSRQVSTDVSHAIFTPRIHGANMLRGLAGALDDEAEVTLARLALTESVLRGVRRDGTLGGLLEDDRPARRGKSIVVIDIRVAARSVGGLEWVFGKGDEERRCLAEPAILEFYEAVRAELRARRDAS